MSFLCTLFYIFLTPKKLQIELLKCFLGHSILHYYRWVMIKKQVMIKNSHFADFEQVKKLVFIFPTLDKSKINLMTWDKSKITNSKTPVGETGYLCICFLFRPLHHVTGTPPWLLRPMRVSTSSELYPDTWLFLFLNA